MKVLERAYGRAKEALIPLSVHFDLTHRCHQRCIHCYLPEAWRRGEGPGPELTTDQVKSILDQLAAAGTFFLTFSGGEIFSRPDCLSILEYARSLSFSLSLFTSGTFGLSNGQIQNLAELGIEALYVSLYHLEAPVHDEITGMAGSWKRLWKTIERCQAHSLNVVFNCCVMSNNFLGVPKLKKFAEQKNITLRLDDQLTPVWDGSPHTTAVALSTEDKRWLYHELGEPFPEEACREPLTVPANFEDKACDVGFFKCYITPQGVLWPCMELPWSCGSIIDEDFTKIWVDSSTLNMVRKIQEENKPFEAPLCAYAKKLRSFSGEKQQAFDKFVLACRQTAANCCLLK